MAEKTKLHSLEIISMSSSTEYMVREPNFFPADLLEAATAVTSNQGWFFKIDMSRWPTIPVAPKIPTGIFLFLFIFAYLIAYSCATTHWIESVFDIYRDIFQHGGPDSFRMNNLRAIICHFFCFFVRYLSYKKRVFHLFRIFGHNAIHVRPYFNHRGVQSRAYQRSRVIRTSPTESCR